MALQKTIVVQSRLSDLSGDAGAETQRFAINGEVYRLDMTPAEFDALILGTQDEDGNVLVTFARIVAKCEELGQVRETTPASDGSAKREWAKANAERFGWTIGDRGRMPAAVDTEYARAQAASDAAKSEAVTDKTPAKGSRKAK